MVAKVWGQLQIKGVGAASAEHIAARASVKTSKQDEMVLMTANGFLPLDGLLSEEEWTGKFGQPQTCQSDCLAPVHQLLDMQCRLMCCGLHSLSAGVFECTASTGSQLDP